jgi:hypothetical protein
MGLGFFLFPYLFAVSVQAVSICPAGFENLCKIGPDSNPNLFGNIVQILIVIAIALSLIFLARGGIRWIMSGGDKAKIEQARSAIIAAIIGLLVSLLAYFIVNMVLSMVGANITTLNIPHL